MLRSLGSTVARRTSLLARNNIQRSAPGAGSVLPSRRAQFHASLRRDEEAAKSSEAAPAAAKTSSWDPFYAVPIGIAFAVPAINYEWYLVNEETQLAACFIAFTAIVYKQFGGVLQEALEADGKRVLAEHNAAEDQIISHLQTSIDNMKAHEGIVQDIEGVKALKAETYVKLNEAGKIKPLYDFKAQIEKLLSMMVTEETNSREKAKIAMMEEATTAVSSAFTGNKELQKSALNSAIATLKGQKLGTDPVKETYLKFFANKKAAGAKMDEAAEAKAARESMILKLNSVAKNEGFFFEFDEKMQPKMVV